MPKSNLTSITHACGHTVSHAYVGHFGVSLYKRLEQQRPCQPCITAQYAARQALQDLRESAQKILLLTEGMDTIPEAAQRLYHQVNANNTSPDVHRYAEQGLEQLSICVKFSMANFIECYSLGYAQEQRLDAEGNHGNS